MTAWGTKKNNFTFGIKVKCRVSAITMTLGNK